MMARFRNWDIVVADGFGVPPERMAGAPCPRKPGIARIRSICPKFRFNAKRTHFRRRPDLVSRRVVADFEAPEELVATTVEDGESRSIHADISVSETGAKGVEGFFDPAIFHHRPTDFKEVGQSDFDHFDGVQLLQVRDLGLDPIASEDH